LKFSKCSTTCDRLPGPALWT